MANFAITGVGGFVAPRHLKAIADTGNQLVCALDPNDSVGILDNYFPDALFFTSDIRFERHIEKMRLDGDQNQVDYLSICTPNFVHDSHIRMGLRAGANVLCEKPMVISPWNLDQIAKIEQETGQRAYTVLQLRYHEMLRGLKNKLDAMQNRPRADVVLTYITRRGHWYHISWKGREDESGGLAMNIGVHFFDLLLWLFGDVESSEVHLSQPDKMAGRLELNHATVRWFLSVDYDDLPQSVKDNGGYAYRSLTMDGQELEFSTGFTHLHTTVYQEMLKGNGFGLDAARPSIDTVHQIRTSDVQPGSGHHPFLKTR